MRRLLTWASLAALSPLLMLAWPGATSAQPRAWAAGCEAPPPEPAHPLSHRSWLHGVVITEYYPSPERWFHGRRVRAPGLPGKHPVDWLYGDQGLAMEGTGITASGRLAHIEDLGESYWVNSDGHPTRPVCLGEWSDGSPFSLAGRSGVTFAPGPALPVRYYHSVAVDPSLIPEGSRIYIPAYKHINGGWFVAEDTGGAINGKHIDVYRPPPKSPSNLGRYMRDQRVLVIPPR